MEPYSHQNQKPLAPVIPTAERGPFDDSPGRLGGERAREVNSRWKTWGRSGEKSSEKASKGHTQMERVSRREGSPWQDLEPLPYLLCSPSLVLLWMPHVGKEVRVFDWLSISSQQGGHEDQYGRRGEPKSRWKGP